jgi:hypothetical protein
MNHVVTPRRLGTLIVALTLVGCESKIRLDEEALELRLDRIEETTPLCGADNSTSALRVVSQLAQAARVARAIGLTDRPMSASGACGGTLEATSAHESGVTDYVLTMQDFCLQSDGGDVVLDGVVLATENGRPTDSGPIISSLEVETDGIVSLDHVDGGLEVEIDGIRVDYGYPETWAPGVPDEKNPDVTTVKEATVAYVDGDGRVDYLRDLRVERTGDFPSVLEVVKGQVGTEGEGYVDVQTAEDDPVVFNVSTLQVESGTIELHGAGGTVANIQRDPSTPGAFVVALEDGSYTRTLDCSDAVYPFVQGGLALLFELPIY